MAINVNGTNVTKVSIGPHRRKRRVRIGIFSRRNKSDIFCWQLENEQN